MTIKLFKAPIGLAASLSIFIAVWAYALSARSHSVRSEPFHDITPAAILGQQADYDAWANNFRYVLQARVDAVPIAVPSGPVQGDILSRRGYTLRRLDFTLPSGPTIETLVAVPQQIDPTKPLIVAVSGHEVPWGRAPVAIFEPGGWGERWVQAGYVVYAPSNLWYDQLGTLSDRTAGTHDYTAVWVKMHMRLWDAVQHHLPAFTGRVATGLSSGALTAAWWAALDPGFTQGVYAGHHVALNFLRENYRIRNMPNVWEIKELLSYTGLFALTSPRPMQMQIGRRDAFYPDLNADPPIEPYFTGLPRPPSTDEFLGPHFAYERIWQRTGARYEFHVHDGGHVYNFDAALAFVSSARTRH